MTALCVGGKSGSISGNQMRLCLFGPVLDIVIQGDLMPWLSSLGGRQDLHASGAAAKRSKGPRICAMHAFVNGAPDEPCSQRIGKQFEGLVFARPNAPGAVEHQSNCRKWRQHLFQVEKPIEERMVRRLTTKTSWAVASSCLTSGPWKCARTSNQPGTVTTVRSSAEL